MTYYFARELHRREGFEVEVCVPPGCGRVTGAQPEFTVRDDLPLWIPSFGRRPWRAINLMLSGLKTDADIVHAIVEFPYAVLASSVARGRPFIVSGQGTYSVTPFLRPLDAWPYRRALRRAAVITAPSRFTADAIRHHLGADTCVTVLPNPVDTTVFTPASGRPEHEGTRIILSVGALKHRKGFDVLLKAFAVVAESDPDCRLVIVGSGDPSSLQGLADELRISERVDFAGPVSLDVLVDLYRASSVFALLPREVGGHFEGFGLVFLEAGACGTPVVGAASGGVPDAVVDGETGFLVRPDDPLDAAEKILVLLRDRHLAERMAAAGRAHAERHSWPRYVDAFSAIYERLYER